MFKNGLTYYFIYWQFLSTFLKSIRRYNEEWRRKQIDFYSGRQSLCVDILYKKLTCCSSNDNCLLSHEPAFSPAGSAEMEFAWVPASAMEDFFFEAAACVLSLCSSKWFWLKFSSMAFNLASVCCSVCIASDKALLASVASNVLKKRFEMRPRQQNYWWYNFRSLTHGYFHRWSPELSFRSSGFVVFPHNYAGRPRGQPRGRHFGCLMNK